MKSPNSSLKSTVVGMLGMVAWGSNESPGDISLPPVSRGRHTGRRGIKAYRAKRKVRRKMRKESRRKS